MRTGDGARGREGPGGAREPFAERVRDLEELRARHEVEADVEGVEEYLVMMTEAWRRELESA